jgi:hypothetical protein
MRCPDCNKFVGFDEGNVNLDIDIDEDSGRISISGEVTLPCAECGQDLKQLSVSEEVEGSDSFDSDPLELVKAKLPEGSEEITQAWFDEHCTVAYEGSLDSSYHEQQQTHDRRGKPIKNSRYAKTYKGAEITGTITRTITCDVKGVEPIVEEESFEHTIEEQASAFDELV